MRHITQVDSTLWALISRLEGTNLQTPYTPKNIWFRIDAIDEASVSITTRDGGSAIKLRRAAFQQTLDYLTEHEHFGEARAIAIESNTKPEQAGPLCQAARRHPDGTLGARVINYILPILEKCQAVAISRMVRPTTTWLVTERELADQFERWTTTGKMETYRANGDATYDQPCSVTFENEFITVSYLDDQTQNYYKGQAKASGHYELQAVDFDGRATLHGFRNSCILEGSWIEEGRRGMWRIVF